MTISFASTETPPTRTAQNVGVGSTDAEVRTGYQNVIEAPAQYNQAPAHDILRLDAPNRAAYALTSTSRVL
jgi:hypothetical protein